MQVWPLAAHASGIKNGLREEMTKEAEKKAILSESYYKYGDMAVNKIASEVGCIKKCGSNFF